MSAAIRPFSRAAEAARTRLRLVGERQALAGDGRTAREWIQEAQVAEREGRRDDARVAFEAALHRIGGPTAPRDAAVALRGIARTYVYEAAYDIAWDCLEVAVAIAEANGDLTDLGHAKNIQAVVRWQQGQLDDAERLYGIARAHARQAKDTRLAAMAAQNLGILANVRGDHELARQHYEASLADYRTIGMVRDICIVLNNLGLLATHETRWFDAHRAFDEAREIADLAGELSIRIALDVNVAELWVAQSDYEEALLAIGHAIELIERTGDDTSLGQAAKLEGIIARESGRLAEADRHFVRSEQIAAKRKDLLLQAEVARERADLARRLDRNRDVLQHLNRAHALFGTLRAARELNDIDRRFVSLEREFIEVARRWAESIEAKDHYTRGHCERVANLSTLIAERAGFDESSLFWFRIGALLHDVGKIVIPSAILNKHGALDEAEWALMRSHTTAGVEVLSGIEFPWDIRPIIQYHHERWDGDGYHGLAGEQIPLVARILCVADVYDALRSQRSYKQPMSHDSAMDTLRADVSRVFDPQVFVWFEEVAPTWATRMASE